MFLGDIAISFERIMSESMEQEKTFEEYFSHILIHGLLHLFGYDHILDEEAEIMEKLEIKIMNEVGYKYKPTEFNDQMVSQNL
jgi:probable rRNA maturation factor